MIARLLPLALCLLLSGCFNNEEPDKSSGASGDKASVQMHPKEEPDKQ